MCPKSPVPLSILSKVSGSSFAAGTDFSQLVMVPLQNTHSANSIIQQDRMLWISGSLTDSNFGNASSALFDGEQIIPYIASSSASGDPGIVSSLFHSFSSFSFTQRRKWFPLVNGPSWLNELYQTSLQLVLSS